MDGDPAGLAHVLAAIPTFVAAATFPLLRLEGQGIRLEASVLGGVQALGDQGKGSLAALVLTTTVLLPTLHLALLIAWLLSRRSPVLPVAPVWTVHILRATRPWIQLDIFLLAALVALAKLATVFQVTPGPGLGFLIAFLLLQERALRLAGLPARLARRPALAPGASGLQRPAALLVTAAVLMLPANLLPVMTTRTLIAVQQDTIMSGVVDLWRRGSWLLAVVVFVASIVIPVLKIAALAWLVATAARRAPGGPRSGARLHRLLERLGRWSMLDIFVMGLLAALVRSRMAAVEINAGATAFGAVVVVTMLASASLDARLPDAGEGTSRG